MDLQKEIILLVDSYTLNWYKHVSRDGKHYHLDVLLKNSMVVEFWGQTHEECFMQAYHYIHKYGFNVK